MFYMDKLNSTFMETAHNAQVRANIEPLPENFRSVQPGGGTCCRIELAWGVWRRWWLKRFRKNYVRHMAQLRRGSCDGAPHEILDPRDLKYCRNICQCDWDQADDLFRWRDRLPFARWGLAELQIFGWPLLALTILAAIYAWPLAFIPGILFCLVVYFFRDPLRCVPVEQGVIVSPADGKISEIAYLDQEDFIGGPAVRISIFLSIFNVHLNRAPLESRVIALRYAPGEFLNAMRPESARRNENTWIGLEEESPPYRRLIVRQISGAIARRIVCNLRPGEVIARGQKFGMIKFGSRTDLILPHIPDLKLEIKVGDRVKAGSTVIGKW
jgi:phosphatidylserine decarboxylase